MNLTWFTVAQKDPTFVSPPLTHLPSQVLDARHAVTPKDMFEAICHHIKYANNGGNIRYGKKIVIVEGGAVMEVREVGAVRL